MRMMPRIFALPLLLLPATAIAQTDTAAPVVSPNAPEAVKCRRIDITGSLVRKTRVCKTNAEWKRIREGNDSELDKMQDTFRTGSLQHTSG